MLSGRFLMKFLLVSSSGDTFDILALINNSVNFILYCFMSRAFRETFKQTFFECKKVDRRTSSGNILTTNSTVRRQRISSENYSNIVVQPVEKTLNPEKRRRSKVSLRIFHSSRWENFVFIFYRRNKKKRRLYHCLIDSLLIEFVSNKAEKTKPRRYVDDSSIEQRRELRFSNR